MIIYLEGPRDFLSIQERQWSLQDTRVQLRQVHLANDFCLSRNMTASNLMARTLKTVEHGNVNFKIDKKKWRPLHWSRQPRITGAGTRSSLLLTQADSLANRLVFLSFGRSIFADFFVLDFSQTNRLYFCPLLGYWWIIIVLSFRYYYKLANLSNHTKKTNPF